MIEVGEGIDSIELSYHSTLLFMVKRIAHVY